MDSTQMQQGPENMRLNTQQVEMLQLFKEPMPEEDYEQMRRLAVQLLAKKIDTLMEKWESDNGITEEYYENLSHQHFRSSKKAE